MKTLSEPFNVLPPPLSMHSFSSLPLPNQGLVQFMPTLPPTYLLTCFYACLPTYHGSMQAGFLQSKVKYAFGLISMIS